MPLCLDCGLNTDDRGRLSIDWACTMNDLFTCVDNIQGAPAGETSGLGSKQQWPKRFDTHLVHDPDNEGYFTLDRDGDGNPDGNPATDDPSFIGQPIRGFTSSFDQIECPESTPSYSSSANVVVSENFLEVKNRWDIPVMVDVQAAAWYHDLTLPQRDDGGARWLGEVRARISNDDGQSWINMPWQRAAELTLTIQPNQDYNNDIHNVLGLTEETAVTVSGIGDKVAECLVTLADVVDAIRCGDEDDDPCNDTTLIRNCIAQLESVSGLAEARFEKLAQAILASDRGQLCNPAYTDRRVETHGNWQHMVLVQPNQTIRVETQSKFARWSRGSCTSDVGEFCFCEAGGSARAGKITMVAHPVYGGQNCNDITRYGQPWWDSSLDTGNYGTDGN